MVRAQRRVRKEIGPMQEQEIGTKPIHIYQNKREGGGICAPRAKQGSAPYYLNQFFKKNIEKLGFLIKNINGTLLSKMSSLWTFLSLLLVRI